MSKKSIWSAGVDPSQFFPLIGCVSFRGLVKEQPRVFVPNRSRPCWLGVFQTDPRERRAKTWPRRGVAAWVLVVPWAGLVGLGMFCLWRYEHAAGTALPSPDRWPADSQIERANDRFTLLLFAHPKCPCTRASIEELSRLMTVCRHRINAHVLFVKPGELCGQQDWEATDLWTAAERIPGVTVTCDAGGMEARRFNAMTSGLVVLFDAEGKMRFQGGITLSRGHSGDNAGRSAIEKLVQNGFADLDRTEVFGCELGTEWVELKCCQK